MLEVFKGWRRKLGCVTLVMALALTGAWVRSLAASDVLMFPIDDRQQMICATNGYLYWWGATLPGLKWYVDSIEQPVGQTLIQLAAERIKLQAAGSQLAEWNIPFWSLAIPLAAVSACLILWRPRIPGNGSPRETLPGE